MLRPGAKTGLNSIQYNEKVKMKDTPKVNFQTVWKLTFMPLLNQAPNPNPFPILTISPFRSIRCLRSSGGRSKRRRERNARYGRFRPR